MTTVNAGPALLLLTGAAHAAVLAGDFTLPSTWSGDLPAQRIDLYTDFRDFAVAGDGVIVTGGGTMEYMGGPATTFTLSYHDELFANLDLLGQTAIRADVLQITGSATVVPALIIRHRGGGGGGIASATEEVDFASGFFPLPDPAIYEALNADPAGILLFVQPSPDFRQGAGPAPSRTRPGTWYGSPRALAPSSDTTGSKPEGPHD